MDMIHDAARVAPGEAQRAVGAAKTTPSGARGGEYLTFRLGAEEYGIDILRVQEIRSYEPPMRIAHASDFIKGVINLRGVIVPIVDLRVKLACEKAEFDSFTVVIVLNIAGRVVGAVVDGVRDVLQLGAEQVKPAPEISSAAIDTRYIIGIGSLTTDGRDRMLILTDITALMGSAAMGLVEAAQMA